MKKYISLAAVLLVAAFSAQSQEKMTEPSTGKSFDAKVSFSQNGTDYSLQLTGVAVRKKMVFKVYGMAHYMQDPPKSSEDAAYSAILADGKAKQISMIFVRDVDKQKIHDTYLEGFKENTSAEDFKKIQSAVDQYVGFFTKDVKENDQFVIRWLPGGIISATVQGEQKPAITNPLFARTLWTIWFGEDSIVDREDLVSKMIAK